MLLKKSRTRYAANGFPALRRFALIAAAVIVFGLAACSPSSAPSVPARDEAPGPNFVVSDASHNGRPNERALARFLAQSPEKSQARFIVAAGHIHNYERFFQEGIVYLVSGGGGAKPRPVVRGPEDLYQDPGFPNYHYVRMVEKGDNLNATMIRVADPDAATPAWQEKDHFEISATPHAERHAVDHSIHPVDGISTIGCVSLERAGSPPKPDDSMIPIC